MMTPEKPIMQLGTDPDEALGLAAVQMLFQTLNRRGIQYCLWKSNVRLEDALNGRTDIDLLVSAAQRATLRQILRDADVKWMLAAPGRRFPNLEDFVGFDPASGRQFHLHVHYQLVLGEQFVKNYHVPLEAHFLHAPIWRHGVRLPPPSLELVVLLLRALLKYRDRDIVKDVLTIRTPGIPEDIVDEVRWLLAQTSREAVSEVLRTVQDIVPADIVLDILDTLTTTPRDGAALYRLRQRLRRALRDYQRRHRLGAMQGYFWEMWRRRNSLLRFSPPPGMTLVGGGLTVALVGVDGAGKTTLAQAITEWLRWKMDVHAYYLGSKQPSRASDWSYLVFRMARRSHSEVTRRLGEGNLISRAIAPLRDGLLYSHYLFVGRDRYRRYRAGDQRARAGSVVVYDRYPLEAPLDGPQIHLLASDERARVAALFVRLEQRLYRQMRRPDLLVVLEVSPKISLQRKPDHAWETLLGKNRALTQLVAGLEAQGSAPVRIDAGRPLPEVLAHLKREIWQRLGAPGGGDDR